MPARGMDTDSSTTVACEHADRCGGCPVIGLPYTDQLGLKRGRVVQALGRYPALDLVYTEPLLAAEPVVSYRTRAKLMVGRGGDVGLYARGGGHQVVDIPRCRVLSPLLSRLAESLRARIRQQEEDGGALGPFDGQRGGTLRAVDLREVREGAHAKPRALLTLVVQRTEDPRIDALREAAEALRRDHSEIAGVAVNFHVGDTPQVLGPQTVHLAGVDAAADAMGASVHLATFGSFVQAHRAQARRVHDILLAGLGLEGEESADRPRRVLDLYGGSGAIALALAKAGAEVTLVEAFGPAAELAARAAEQQHLSVRAIHADTASALRGLRRDGQSFDAIVVNPPRRGTSPAARELMARLEATTIAYVSCDPETLARDLDHLSRMGYRAARLQPLDMIPLTDEVETVALLHRAPPPRPHVAFEDETVLLVAKSPHEPTSPQGDEASSLTARVRQIPGAEEAVPVHGLDPGASGLVLYARRPDFVAPWRGALAAESSRRIYLAAVRGVTASKGTVSRDLREDGRVHSARTRYRRLAVIGGHCVLRVVPDQDRTHQIRRHLAAVGHPVLGDDRYGHGPTNRYFDEKHGLDRTFVHCVRMEVEHPLTGERMVVESPLPGDLRLVLERTSGPGTLRFLDHKHALGTGGVSSVPPEPDSGHARGSALDVDGAPVTVRPEIVGDDDAGPREA